MRKTSRAKPGLKVTIERIRPLSTAELRSSGAQGRDDTSNQWPDSDDGDRLCIPTGPTTGVH